MKDLPRQKLVEIVKDYGDGIIDNPQRCRAILMDFCSEYRREVSVLVTAVEEHIPCDLLSSNHFSKQVILTRLATRMEDNRAIVPADAKWAVDSWAIALGIISSSDLTSPQVPNPQPSQTISSLTPSTSSLTQVNAPQSQQTSSPITSHIYAPSRSTPRRSANISKSPMIAAILSFFLLGGAGHIYLGQWKKGLAIILANIPLGGLGIVILGPIAVGDAYGIAQKLKRGGRVNEWEFCINWKAVIVAVFAYALIAGCIDLLV